MRELIERGTVRYAVRLICAETKRTAEGRGLTAEEVETFTQRIEAAIKAAPVIATAANGFDTCKHYPKAKGARGCSLLTERVCAVKGKCGFFTPDEPQPEPEPEAEPGPDREWRTELEGFPDNMRVARMAAGLSMAQLGEKIGISRQRINKWENGDGKPTAANLKKLADGLGVSVEELLKNEATVHI